MLNSHLAVSKVYILSTRNVRLEKRQVTGSRQNVNQNTPVYWKQQEETHFFIRCQLKHISNLFIYIKSKPFLGQMRLMRKEFEV